MTIPPTFVRRSAHVQALRLDGPRELACAHLWLRGHGVRARHHGDVLVLYSRSGSAETARIGQVLTLEPDTGEFRVWDAAEFEVEHHRPGPLLQALIALAEEEAP